MLREFKDFLGKLLRRKPTEPPRDPYAEVGAPKRPKRPLQSGAVALAEPDEN